MKREKSFILLLILFIVVCSSNILLSEENPHELYFQRLFSKIEDRYGKFSLLAITIRNDDLVLFLSCTHPNSNKLYRVEVVLPHVKGRISFNDIRKEYMLFMKGGDNE